MGQALVLNATYEPLGVVSPRRAAVLALVGKADIVHDAGVVLHSERMSVPVPSVIRLRVFVSVPYRRAAPLTRRALYARDNHRCQYCAGPAESIDHVIPRSRGGTHTWENVVAACRPCNVSKRDRLLSETSMALRRPPRAPSGRHWLTFCVGTVPTDWEPYLGVDRLSA
jgi:5-methylcytosine-specific restriction endonuclease McrA